ALAVPNVKEPCNQGAETAGYSRHAGTARAGTSACGLDGFAPQGGCSPGRQPSFVGPHRAWIRVGIGRPSPRPISAGISRISTGSSRRSRANGARDLRRVGEKPRGAEHLARGQVCAGRRGHHGNFGCGTLVVVAARLADPTGGLDLTSTG